LTSIVIVVVVVSRRAVAIVVDFIARRAITIVVDFVTRRAIAIVVNVVLCRAFTIIVDAVARCAAAIIVDFVARRAVAIIVNNGQTPVHRRPQRRYHDKGNNAIATTAKSVPSSKLLSSSSSPVTPLPSSLTSARRLHIGTG